MLAETAWGAAAQSICMLAFVHILLYWRARADRKRGRLKPYNLITMWHWAVRPEGWRKALATFLLSGAACAALAVHLYPKGYPGLNYFFVTTVYVSVCEFVIAARILWRVYVVCKR